MIISRVRIENLKKGKVNNMIIGKPDTLKELVAKYGNITVKELLQIVK